jgi:hypothetical protein
MNRKFIAAVLGIGSFQHYVYEAGQVAFIFEKCVVKQRKLVAGVHHYESKRNMFFFQLLT